MDFFYIHVDPFEREQNFGPYLVTSPNVHIVQFV
jgi:hypothetical protein